MEMVVVGRFDVCFRFGYDRNFSKDASGTGTDPDTESSLYLCCFG